MTYCSPDLSLQKAFNAANTLSLSLSSSLHSFPKYPFIKEMTKYPESPTTAFLMALLCLSRPPLLLPASSRLGSPTHRRFHFKPIFYASLSSPSPTGPPKQPLSWEVPARDRVIDFGKHRGKMLGTLPSSYLTWVSKNLRTRDYEEWAKLADEVLRDPVYRDRLEWESAERVLSGAGLRASSSSSSEFPVAELLDISERFGWDNEDKEAWRRVDFQLLGTSRGGRIPRLPKDAGGGSSAPTGHKGLQLKGRGRGGVRKVRLPGMDSRVLGRREVTGSSGKAVGWERSGEFGSPRKGLALGPQSRVGKGSRFTPPDAENSSTGDSDSSLDKDCWVHEAEMTATLNGRKVGHLSKGIRFTVGEQGSPTDEAVKEKREERRERQRLKREQRMRMLSREVGDGVGRGGGDSAATTGQLGDEDAGYSNPFPGRGALLDKIRGREA